MIQKPSPNFEWGRRGKKPFAVVLHIMEGSLQGTDDWFSNPASQVSSHYGIGKNGEVHQYVKEQDTAWANGSVHEPTWKLLQSGNPNLYTISIEHEGHSVDYWPDSMRQASGKLVADICARWNIPMDRDHIIGHYEIEGVGKPNCPAVDKSIIDDILKIANLNTQISLLKKVVEFLKSLLFK